MSGKRKVRIGVVGAGGHSMRRVLPELSNIPEVDLVSVANRTLESTDKTSKAFNFSRSDTNWEDIVNADDIDVIFNGTQAPEHHKVILESIKNKKHVFTMNPLAMTSEEGRDILRATEENPEIKFKQYPSFAQNTYAREDAVILSLLKENSIGRILGASVYWYTPYLALASYQEIVNRWLGDHINVLAHRKQFEIGGETVHGKPVRRGITTALATLSNDILVNYTHNTTIAESARNPRIEIYGEEGSIIVHANPRKAVESIFISSTKGELKPVEIPKDLVDSWEEPRGILVEEQYIEWLLTGKETSPILLNASNALKSIDFAEGFVKSLKQGNAWVDLPRQ
jgi:predicted dehydrogenase